MLNDLTALPSPTNSSIVEARSMLSTENPINDIEHAMALLKISSSN